MMKKYIKSFVKSIVKEKEKRDFFSKQTNTYGLTSDEIRRSNRLGFTADEYVIYNLQKNNPTEYISEYERHCFRNVIRDYRILLDNKIVFYSLIRNFAEVNTIYAYKINGCYVALENGFESESIINKLQEYKHVVYKQVYEGGGKGFCLLEYDDGKYYMNRSLVSVEEIQRICATDNYLLEEYCVQGEFENSIWPYSVNTVRIITLYDMQQIKIVAALQRMGVDEETCVDNACAGGLYALIDIETGKLSVARSHAKDRWINEQGKPIIYRKHPITGTHIEGAIIPNWDLLKKSIEDLHSKLLFTGIKFIAWDIALTDNGYKIIEANASCSMDFLQTFDGVRNKEIGIWMKQQGYIG